MYGVSQVFENFEAMRFYRRSVLPTLGIPAFYRSVGFCPCSCLRQNSVVCYLKVEVGTNEVCFVLPALGILCIGDVLYGQGHG